MKSWHVKTLLDAYSSSLHVLDSLHLHVSVAHASASSSGSGFSLALAYMNSTFPFTLFVLLVHCVCFALLYYHFIHWLNSPPPTHRPTHRALSFHSFICCLKICILLMSFHRVFQMIQYKTSSCFPVSYWGCISRQK